MRHNDSPQAEKKLRSNEVPADNSIAGIHLIDVDEAGKAELLIAKPDARASPPMTAQVNSETRGEVRCSECGSDRLEEKDKLVTCLDCRARFRMYQKEGNKSCLRCGGTGKLETDMGVKECYVCCGTGTKQMQNDINHTEKQVED